MVRGIGKGMVKDMAGLFTPGGGRDIWRGLVSREMEGDRPLPPAD